MADLMRPPRKDNPMSERESDFSIMDHGSIVVLTPMNGPAKDRLDEIIEEIEAQGGDVQRWSRGVVIEPRFVADFVNNLEGEGFVVA